MEYKIDMVIPFVDNTDEVWRKIYIDYCKRFNLRNKIVDITTCRYKDNVRLIDYQLKLINKNMPWVNTIFLLLMNREQAPKDLPSNVKIVYHGAFIPQKFLPTFNSTTIEMFLWNIKGLSEHFIYANDDMLPIKPLKPTDFFTEEGKVKINWMNEDLNKFRSVFRIQCYNSYRHTLVRLKKPTQVDIYKRPIHSFTPMVKSHCERAYLLLKDLIDKHIRAFRTEYQYNQYIYPVFEDAIFGTERTTIDYLYTELEKGIDLDHDIICFNIIPTKYAKELDEMLKTLCN